MRLHSYSSQLKVPGKESGCQTPSTTIQTTTLVVMIALVVAILTVGTGYTQSSQAILTYQVPTAPVTKSHFEELDVLIKDMLASNESELIRLEAMNKDIEQVHSALLEHEIEINKTLSWVTIELAENKDEYSLRAKEVQATVSHMNRLSGHFPNLDKANHALARTARQIMRDYIFVKAGIASRKYRKIDFNPEVLRKRFSEIYTLLQLERMNLIANRVLYSGEDSLHRISEITAK